MSSYTEGQRFDKTDFSLAPMQEGEYEDCTFVQCDLSNADLSRISFTSCEFIGCNLSRTKLTKTAFKDVKFKDCKLLGMHFQHCNDFLFAVSFDTCILDLSSFYKLKLKKTLFKNCSLKEVDFAESNLEQAVLDNCDLTRAMFDNTNLEKADLRTAYHYSIDPDANRIKKAKFSKEGVMGLLDKYDIEVG